MNKIFLILYWKIFLLWCRGGIDKADACGFGKTVLENIWNRAREYTKPS